MIPIAIRCFAFIAWVFQPVHCSRNSKLTNVEREKKSDFCTENRRSGRFDRNLKWNSFYSSQILLGPKSNFTNAEKLDRFFFFFNFKCKKKCEWKTHFFGTVETYGINTLSTNEPKPKRKSFVMFNMVWVNESPNLDSFSLSSSIDLDKSMR